MRPIIYTLMAIVTVMLLSSPTSARIATWVDNGSWRIQGDSQSQLCNLALQYDTDDTISMTAGDMLDEPVMTFRGRNLRPLVTNASAVEASLTFANGAFYRIVGKVLGQNRIIAGVSYGAVGDFANTAWMEVRVSGILIGSYKLDGTRNMVLELADCIDAMNDDPA